MAEKTLVIFGSDSVKSPFDALAEERLEAADKVRIEVLTEEIPITPAPQPAEIEIKATTTKAQPTETTVVINENKAIQKDITIGDFVEVITGAKTGLKGTITGGSKSWLQLTIDEGTNVHQAGTVASVRRSELLPTTQNGEKPEWVQAALAIEGVTHDSLPTTESEEPLQEAVIPAGEDFVISDDLNSPENYVLVSPGKHGGKTLNTIYNEGKKGINYLKWIAANELMGQEVTDTIRTFLTARDIVWGD